MGKSETRYVGIGFPGLLALVFITLKLTGTITWSWWWVLSPLWIGFLLGCLIFVGVFVVAVLLTVAKSS